MHIVSLLIVLFYTAFIPFIILLYLPYDFGSNILASISSNSIQFEEYAICYIYTPCAYTFIVINCIRAWLLYFDINLTKFTLQKVWLTAMNPDTATANWFYTNKNTFGNANYLLKYGVTVVVLLVVFSSFARHVFDLAMIETITRWVVSLFVLIFTTAICNKLKASFYNDKLGIRKEMMLMLKCGIAMLIPYVFVQIAFYLQWIENNVYMLLHCCIIAIGFDIYVTLVTLFPKRLSGTGAQSRPGDVYRGLRLDKLCHLFGGVSSDVTKNSGLTHQQPHEPHQQHPKLHSLRPSLSFTRSSSRDSKNNDTSGDGRGFKSFKKQFGYRWQDIVCTKFGFESFMHHLEKELSIENLLFVSEV